MCFVTRTLPASSWRTQPWKNGGGISHEIVRWPETGDFDVRVSVADVDREGQFSTFPGYRRWTVLLTSVPVLIGTHWLFRTGQLVELAGEDVIVARIPVRTVTLLNVFGRPGTVVGCGRSPERARFAFPLAERCGYLDLERSLDDCVWIA